MSESSFSLSNSSNPELNIKSTNTDRISSSDTKSNTSPSFNGHTIQETTDSQRDQLLQDYLAAKAKYDKALANLNHAKGLNFVGKIVWSTLAKIGIGKSLSVKHCQKKLRKAFDDYEATGGALVAHPDFSDYRDLSGFTEHEALNNKVYYDTSKKLSIGVNKFAIEGSKELGAIDKHNIEQEDRDHLSKTTLEKCLEGLKSKAGTDNGTWKIERDSEGMITSLSYDSRPSEQISTKSASIEEVVDTIASLVGHDINTQKTIAYFISPINSLLPLTQNKISSKDFSPLSKLDLSSQGLNRVLQPGEYDLNNEDENNPDQKTLPPSYSQTKLTKDPTSGKLTIEAIQETNQRRLIQYDSSGNPLKTNELATLFTYKEEDSITRTIDAQGTIRCSKAQTKYKITDYQSSLPIQKNDATA